MDLRLFSHHFSGLDSGGAGPDCYGDGGAECCHVHLTVADGHCAGLDPVPAVAGRLHPGDGLHSLLLHQAPQPLLRLHQLPPQERVAGVVSLCVWGWGVEVLGVGTRGWGGCLGQGASGC